MSRKTLVMALTAAFIILLLAFLRDGQVPPAAASPGPDGRAWLPLVWQGALPATPDPPTTGTLWGMVWTDMDADGVMEAGEPPLPGALISLFDSEMRFLAWKPSDARGIFSFDLPPGRYYLLRTNPRGFLSTTADAAWAGVDAGRSVRVDFGAYPAPTPTPSPTWTATASATPTPTATATATASATPMPTATATATAFATLTATSTSTGLPIPTSTPSRTATVTFTPTDTNPHLPTATATATRTVTATPTIPPAGTPTFTPTPSPAVPTPTAWVMAEPAVAYNPDRDEYLIVWDDCRNDPGPPYACVYGKQDFTDIYARLLRGDGTPIGDEIPVATGRLGQQLPDVAYNPTSRRYLVTWQQHAFDFMAEAADPDLAFYQYGYDAYARLLNEAGAPLGEPFLLSEKFALPEDQQWKPVVEANPADGSFLVGWHDGRTRHLFPALYADDATDRTTFKDIYSQRVNGDGSFVRANRALTLDPDNLDFQFVGNAKRIQQYLALAFHPGETPADAGRFFAVWEDDRNGTGNPHSYGPLYYERLDLDIFGGFFDGDGNAIGAPANLPIYQGEGAQRYPRLAYNPDEEEYLVVFQSYVDGDAGRTVYAQRVSAEGEPIGVLLEIDGAAVNYIGYESFLPRPDAAYNPVGGEYLIVWTRREYSSTSVWGRRIRPNGAGAVLSPIFQISSVGNEPHVVYNARRNHFLVVYYYGSPARIGYAVVAGSSPSP